MTTRADRLARLLDALHTADGPVPAASLATRLGVTSRSVRAYVREANEGPGPDLVVSSQLGYRLDETAYRRYREDHARRHQHTSAPRQRLVRLLHDLVANDAVDVFALGEELSVSPATVEADLGRARAVLREYALHLRRTGASVRLEGSERQQRRLVRQLLLTPELGASPPAASRVLESPELRELTDLVRGVLRSTGLEVNEYVLGDIVVHLSVVVERLRLGHVMESPSDLHGSDLSAQRAADAVADAVEQWGNVSVPATERYLVHNLLRVSTHQAGGVEAAVDPAILSMVRDAVDAVDEQYAVHLYDETSMLGLAIHVEDMVERARSGRTMARPLGDHFRSDHPLVHELALYFAHRVESATGTTLGDAEIDFLSFHLGSRFQRIVDEEQRMTITAVVPRYGAMTEETLVRLSDAVRGLAVVERAVTHLDDDPADVTSDIVVSSIELPSLTHVPVVEVSPLLTQDDLASVRAAVQAERERSARQKVRSTLIGLLEPALYRHVTGSMTQGEAIRWGCSQLHEAEAVAADFLADVMDRERRSSTSFGGRFAVPHSLYMDASRTALCLLTSEQPIPWGGSGVGLMVMFAVSPDDRSIFRDVLDELVKVLSEPSKVESLIAAGGKFESFVRRFATVLT